MSETVKTVYLGDKFHRKLKGLVGRKAEAGCNTSMREEIEMAVEAHVKEEDKKLKPVAA